MNATRRTFRAAVTALSLAAVFWAERLPEADAIRKAVKAPFTLFESGQVRPLALSPDGRRLFACNTPDNRLEVFKVTGRGLRALGSIPVGLEPVAVAVRSSCEAWVVNHLSDSVSIVHLEDDDGDDDDDRGPRGNGGPVGWVERTLLVGDEPRDVIFAGHGGNRAFVTTAHRGQNVPYDPQLSTPGVGRADIWVFDVHHPASPLTILTLFTDSPRALAASPDGSRVYAAGFLTGNRTTTITEAVVTRNGGLPEPHEGVGHIPAPPTGLIVKFDGQHWVDETGKSWDPFVKFNLPDKDVFAIDATATPPVEVGSWSGVGTTLFNMVVNPANGRVYVSNTDARNEHRFEGEGKFLAQFHKTSVRGHLAESRITVLGPGSVQPRHLNKHINYGACCDPVPSDENKKSLAFPTDLAISGDGKTLYVAAFGSGKVGVFKTSELENDTFTPDVDDQVLLTGGGPSGVVLDEHRRRLYVLTRFDNSISVVDTSTRRETSHVSMHNPEPQSIVRGRRFLYDASLTSSHGDSACASCHIFGDNDGLAWDLGDPDNVIVKNGGIFTVKAADVGLPNNFIDFLPMKGPMTTQSLRGMANHGAMHWRGDRQDNVTPSAQPDAGAFNEQAAFKAFNPAFVGLNGRDTPLSDADLQAFTDFVLQIMYPPNPVRALDNSLTPDQEAGRVKYFNGKTDAVATCNECHVLDRHGNEQFHVEKPGFFGTDGRFSFEFEPQILKIPHLRNMYTKVGKFGHPGGNGFLPDDLNPTHDNPHMGDQIRGFGFLHDGSVDTLFRFHGSMVFALRPPGTLFPTDPGNPEGFPIAPAGIVQRRQLESFLLAFDSNLAPIVGQQATLRADNWSSVAPRLALMKSRAEAGECDLVAKSKGRGYVYEGHGLFRTDRRRHRPVLDEVLRLLALTPGGEVTFTCVPSGAGVRIGIDRDEDGVLDGDE